VSSHTHKVTLNWYGEIYTLYTNSSTDLKALGNAVVQLAKRFGVSRYRVRMYFDRGLDNYKIERR
jgi:hypothetical protein